MILINLINLKSLIISDLLITGLGSLEVLEVLKVLDVKATDASVFSIT